MPRRIDKDAFKAALQNFGCTNIEHQEYVASLVARDFIVDDDIHVAAQSLNQLISSFLWDWKLVNSDSDSSKLSLLILAKSIGHELPSDEDANYQSLKLDEPLQVDKLIKEKFARQIASSVFDVPKMMSTGGASGQQSGGATTTTSTDQLDLSVPVISGGYEDPFLGMEKAQFGASSVVIPIEESLKIAKAQAKKREKQLRLMKQWERSRVPLPPPKRRHGDKDLQKLKDISIDNFSVAVAGRELLHDAALKLSLQHRYGLVGRNGIGKTTFLSALARGEIPHFDKDINVGCVEQEVAEEQLDMTPIEAVLKVDEERTALLGEAGRLQSLSVGPGGGVPPTPGTTTQADTTSGGTTTGGTTPAAATSASAADDALGKRLEWIFHRLETIEADKAEAEAGSILSGLGLSEYQIRSKKVKELSGGWRARVMLARVLFANPDILCLDEPTNHLDVHAVAWLTNFLTNFHKHGVMIIVSHSRQFLNEVCTDIIDFKDRKLTYYPGNYDVFENARAEFLKHQKKALESQQNLRDHMQKFIDRFRYNANRAALVQSRLKALQKLPMIEAINEDPQLQFNFTTPTELPTPVLVMQQCSFSYKPEDNNSGSGGTTTTGGGDAKVLDKVDLSADLQTRIAICGVNGSGKTTLLKLLLGHLEPDTGFVFRHGKLKIGYFAQHHLDGLDLTQNAVQQLQSMYPHAKLSDLQARNFLGKFGITGLLALEPMFILSGGQKSRVAIACMAFDEPHILLMDEPTNHLDLDGIQALIAALNTFEGGVILVSHDSHLLTCVAEEVYHLNPTTKQLQKFKGDFEEYRQQVLKHKI